MRRELESGYFWIVLCTENPMGEPYKLRCWKPPPPLGSTRFFTCARPGRSKSKDKRISDDLVDRWVEGLPGGSKTVVVSLLGRKHGPDGTSEFSFYSFCGGCDSPSERGRRPSFQQWLDHRHKDKCIRVIEHPTYDFHPVPKETLFAVRSDISRLLKERRTVVLVDSGGETRTRKVCTFMGATEDSSRSS